MLPNPEGLQSKDRRVLPYWLLFAYFAVGALLVGDRRVESTNRLFLFLAAVVVALMIGLRYKVGADWRSYEFIFDYAKVSSLSRMLQIGDPGYMLLNWTVHELGAEIWAVNLFCAIVFTWGLMRLVLVQPLPWLAMLVAVPYLIIVVAMGYTRQGVAIGILMAGLASLDRTGSTIRFAFFVAAAALFHKTAVFALPLVTFASRRNKLLNIAIAAVSFWLLFTFFLKDSVDGFVENYIQRQYSSQGAAIRLVMTVIPAILYLSASNRFGFTAEQKVVWRNMSFAALGLMVLLMTTPSSTAIDRIALYVLPLQIVILARIPQAYTSQGFGRTMVVGYSAAILYVWLNFAVHAEYWVPYRLYPL